MIKLFRKPAFIVLLSFFGVILIGTLILWLPISINGSYKTSEGINHLKFIDALFTATSATCVTGLITVPTAGAFSVFGKIIIAILIEIGGLSFLTIASFIIILSGARITMGERYLLKENLNQETVSGTVRLVKKIVLVALIIQAIGALINFFIFVFGEGFNYSVGECLGISIFHSISSFNNAGFDIFGNDTSMIEDVFSKNVFLNANTMVLIILGGISTIVILDIFKSKKWNKLSLHSKVVLSTTLFLLVTGTVLLKIAGGKDITFLESLFQSVSSRTAGFATVDLAKYEGTHSAIYIILIILMFIGASPSSTGGGIKTATFFVIMSAIFSLVTGREPNAFNRRMPKGTILKAFVLATLATIFCIISTFFILIFNPEFTTIEALFEAVSAFATVGLSTGITYSLSIGSKIVIILTMFVGRVGLLTLVSTVNRHSLDVSSDTFNYIEEKVLVG